LNLERLKKAGVEKWKFQVTQLNNKLIFKICVWTLGPPEPLVSCWGEEIENYFMELLRKEIN